MARLVVGPLNYEQIRECTHLTIGKSLITLNQKKSAMPYFVKTKTATKEWKKQDRRVPRIIFKLSDRTVLGFCVGDARVHPLRNEYQAAT